ncbi:hypothetical protein DMP23_47105 [Amycolatopsis sp. A1MSW2902]
MVAAREKVAKAERARDLAEERVAAARAAYDRAVALESGQDAPAASAPLFASLPTFVDRYVLPNWRHRHDRDTRWCEQWWLHEEAVTRLEALWEAFEAMRLEPAPSLSTWLRDHFDHHMSMLTRADGAFANCAPRTHDDPVHRAGPYGRTPNRLRACSTSTPSPSCSPSPTSREAWHDHARGTRTRTRAGPGAAHGSHHGRADHRADRPHSRRQEPRTGAAGTRSSPRDRLPRPGAAAAAGGEEPGGLDGTARRGPGQVPALDPARRRRTRRPRRRVPRVGRGSRVGRPGPARPGRPRRSRPTDRNRPRRGPGHHPAQRREPVRAGTSPRRTHHHARGRRPRRGPRPVLLPTAQQPARSARRSPERRGTAAGVGRLAALGRVRTPPHAVTLGGMGRAHRPRSRVRARPMASRGRRRRRACPGRCPAPPLGNHRDRPGRRRAGPPPRPDARGGLDPNRADLAIGTSLTPAGRPDRPLDPNALDDAAVADLVRTWESARVTAILEPDNAATALDNADLLERHFRDRFGIDPATYLADALQDTAAAAADAARDQDAVATALSEETAIAHDISASTATGAPVEIRYRDVVLPAGPDNPDRGVAPTKAGSDAERAHRAQAWRLAQAGMDETAWKALPSKDRYDRYWTVYDAQEARQVQIPENGTLGPAAPLTSASEDSAKTPQPERTAPAAAADPRQLAIDAIENLWPHDAEWIIASQTRSVDQLGDRLQEAAEKGYEPLEIMREAVISSGTERLMQPNSAPGDTVDTSAGNRYPPGVTHPGTIGTDPAKFAARQIRRELDNRGTASTAAKDPTPERTKPAAPTSATGSQAPAAPSARPSVAPKEERGMAPSKASTPQERARRATAWALAEQSFRAELPADTSSMAAGKAWQEMAWQDKALRYWTAYDSAEARTAAGLEPVAAPQTAPPRRTAPAPNETPAISRERTIELNTLAADYFATSMTPDSPGYAYLAGRLGADVVADDRWRFGYAPTGWSNLTGHLRSHGATDTEIVAAGLGRQSTRGQVIDFFRDRAMVGIRDQDGDIVGFIGRDLSGDERAPKYLNTGSTPAYTKGDHLLGLYEAPDSARLARVEGPFDAVAVTAAGDGQVAGVAPLGTALTDRQADQLAERGRIWEMLDADAAGRTAAEKDFWLLAERGVDVRDIPLPDGLDPAKMWEDKRDDLRARLADLDNARSGAFLVIDNAIAELRPRLIAGDDDAAAEIGFTEHRVREHAPEDQRDQLLSYSVDEVAQLQYDAGQEAVEQVLSEMRATEGELDQAQSIIDDERATAVQPGDRDSGPDRTEARPASANYDRAESVPETIDDDARQARTVSAYGYPRSTRDMLAETDNRKATQAKPRPQTPGSGRATHIRSQRR